MKVDAPGRYFVSVTAECGKLVDVRRKAITENMGSAQTRRKTDVTPHRPFRNMIESMVPNGSLGDAGSLSAEWVTGTN